MLFNDCCLSILPTIQENSIDSLITDPPAGISFMNKKWDAKENFIPTMTEIYKACLRVLKPGAHGLVWALPRTSHWTATALENSGFEIRDIVIHLFGSGFPKSLNLGNGCGTGLKPASEHWILVRKPISEGTIAKNVLRWGTGGLNIDGSRIEVSKEDPNHRKATGEHGNSDSIFGVGNSKRSATLTQGRFPANLILDEEAAEMLDEQSGILKSGELKPYKRINNEYYSGAWPDSNFESKASIGGASRFFYCAKASKKDRGEDNKHPCVKNTKLMEYLIRLITPPNGTVLDCFMGSGSTGVSAKGLGFKFIGIEKEAEYFEIAERRISHGS